MPVTIYRESPNLKFKVLLFVGKAYRGSLTHPLKKGLYKIMKKATTRQEKNALEFGVELLTKYGFGYTIRVPIMELTTELKEKGMKISHPTLMKYFNALVHLGYAKREMTARIFGVTYYLNRYAFQKLINAQ